MDSGQSISFLGILFFLIFLLLGQVLVLTMAQVSVFWDEGFFETRGIWEKDRSPGRTWLGGLGVLCRHLDLHMQTMSPCLPSPVPPEAFFPPQGEIYLPKPISPCRGGAGCKLLRVYF